MDITISAASTLAAVAELLAAQSVHALQLSTEHDCDNLLRSFLKAREHMLHSCGLKGCVAHAREVSKPGCTGVLYACCCNPGRCRLPVKPAAFT